MKHNVLAALEIKPMTFGELRIEFNMTKKQLTNYVTQLRYHGASELNREDRKWYYVKPLPERKRMPPPQEWRSTVVFDPRSNPAMRVTSNSYRTGGVKQSLNAWSRPHENTL